jgi:predicted site-specific integrase-resolvase
MGITLLTRSEICEKFKIRKTTFYRWRKRGIIPDPIIGTKRWYLDTVKSTLKTINAADDRVDTGSDNCRRWLEEQGYENP